MSKAATFAITSTTWASPRARFHPPTVNGSGGMGTVDKATDTQSGVIVAAELMLPQFGAESSPAAPTTHGLANDPAAPSKKMKRRAAPGRRKQSKAPDDPPPPIKRNEPATPNAPQVDELD